MTTYGIWLESGPKQRTTMVHVPELLGCIANGPTTQAALDATPEAIAAYRRFLQRRGEAIELDAPITLEIAEHITEGEWLGNGSPYITVGDDLDPVTPAELTRWLHRADGMLEELAAWADTRTEVQLDRTPERKRSDREVLLHVLGSQTLLLLVCAGRAPVLAPSRTAAERGQLPFGEALRRAGERVNALAASIPAERHAHVRLLPSGTYTLRKAFRRHLEHTWEHLAELSRRDGGPVL